MQSAWQDMDGQFVVSTASAPLAAGAVRHFLTSVVLDVFGDPPVVGVVDRSGRAIGLLIGTVIDCERRTVVRGRLRLDAELDGQSLDALVEDHIYALCGSFIFVLDCVGQRRIYLDASGSKPCVYDPATKRAASSAMVLLDERQYWDRLQRQLYEEFETGAAGWFTADLTAHSGLKRLVCNHYLDLRTWEVRRHWPLEPIAETRDPAAAIDGLMHRVGAAVEAMVEAGEVTLALTAGLDSRLVLASSRAVVDRVGFVTVAAPPAKLDVACARELARRHGLRHGILPYRKASDDQVQVWQVRAGHVLSGHNMTMHPSVFPLRGRYFVGGLGGEVGRGFLWLAADTETRLDAAAIVARLKLPRHPIMVEHVGAWLRPIEHFDTLLKLDLAYLELRMSSWGFADAHANPVRTEIHPMISRANFVAMLSVPPSLRRDGVVFKEAIARAWSQLLDLPINRYGDWRDVTSKGLEIFNNPVKALHKLRQLALVGARSA